MALGTAGRVATGPRASDPDARGVSKSIALGAAAVVVGAAYAVLVPWLARYDVRPGAPVGQSLGIAAALLMLATLSYLPAKRSDALSEPNRRLVRAHIAVGLVGAGVALAHSRLVVGHPPILVLLAFLGLLGTGAYGRVVASRRLAPSFGRGGHPFRPAAAAPAALRDLADHKRAMLASLDPGAREGTFALRLSHWAAHPLRASRYYAASLVERSRMRALSAAGYQTQMSALERWWRIAHLVLAWLAVLGLIAHVVTVLFFAQWAAGDRQVYWWHVRW